MTLITHTDFLLQVSGSGYIVAPGLWVRLLNNSTGTNYYSTAVTTALSAFTHSAPPGDYSLYTGTVATVPGTPTLQNAHYSVPVTAGDDVALGSGTFLSSGPFTASALTGSVNSEIWVAPPTGVAATDTANIQAALTLVPTAGARVRLWPGRYVTNASLIPKSYTSIEGAGMGDAGLQGATQIYGQNMTAPIFDPGVGQVNSITWRDLSLNSSNLSGSKGIHVTLGNQLAIEDCSFSDFGDHAVHIEGGLGGYFANLFIQRSLMIRTGRASLIGCFDIACDAFCTCLTVEGSITPGDGAGNICAIVARANGLMVNCVGGTAQIGIATPSGQSLGHFIGCRAEFNNGPGFQVDGSTTQFLGCTAWKNSQASNNTYPGFNVTGPQNTFETCKIDGLSGDTAKQSNGFSDSNSGGSGSNFYMGNRAGQILGSLLVSTGSQKPVELDFSGLGMVMTAANGQNDLTLTDSTAVAGMHIVNSGGGKYLRTNGTNFELVNAANSAVIFTVSDTGIVTLGGATSQMLGGATGFGITNNANTLYNLLLSDAGVATHRSDLVLGTAPRILTTGTVPTVGSGGAGTSALSIISGSTNTAGQFQVTLTAVAPGVVAGVVAFGGGALATAPKVVVVSLAAPTAGVASPPVVAADTYTTSGFTVRVTGPTTVTTATYIINWIAFF